MAVERKRERKWVWGVAILVVVVAIATGVGLVAKAQFGKNEDKGEAVEAVEVAEKVEERVEKRVESVEEKEKERREEVKAPQYEGGSPNMVEELSGVVSYAGVIGGELVVRVNINQFLAEGTCEMSLKRGGSTIYNSKVAILESVTTSTCDGFKVPTGEIGSGKFEVEIKLVSGSKKGTIKGEAEV